MTSEAQRWLRVEISHIGGRLHAASVYETVGNRVAVAPIPRGFECVVGDVTLVASPLLARELVARFRGLV